MDVYKQPGRQMLLGLLFEERGDRVHAVAVDPYGRLIASFGQTLAHVPHSVQRSGSIE